MEGLRDGLYWDGLRREGLIETFYETFWLAVIHIVLWSTKSPLKYAAFFYGDFSSSVCTFLSTTSSK